MQEAKGDGRRVLDAAVSRTIAERTAWVRMYVRPGRGAPRPDDLRVEGAVDLRRRIAVVAEAQVAPAVLSGRRGRPAGRLVAAFPHGRRVVYAGGSRYVATDVGWAHDAGAIEAPRRPSDPVWLLDALRHAVDCAVEGAEVACRLDLARAEDVDCSGISAAPRWRPMARRREGRLARVRCAVAVGEDGTIARMSFSGPSPDDGGEALWATTEFVEYRVPVEVPDLMARVPAAV